MRGISSVFFTKKGAKKPMAAPSVLDNTVTAVAVAL